MPVLCAVKFDGARTGTSKTNATRFSRVELFHIKSLINVVTILKVFRLGGLAVIVSAGS